MDHAHMGTDEKEDLLKALRMLLADDASRAENGKKELPRPAQLL
jgi:hypothetical protein